MNYLDIILALLLITGMIRGFIKGFIFEVAVLGALFLGLYAAFKFSTFAEPYVLKVIDANPHTLHYISSFVMFLLVSVGIFFLAKLFEGLIKIAALGIFNKILGALFGGLKYALVTSVVLFYFNKLDTKYNWLSPDKKADSVLYYPLLKIAPSVLPVMKTVGEEIQDRLH